MLKKDIKIGGYYLAKVSGKIVTVRVDAVLNQTSWDGKARTTYRVTNLSTGRETTFRSAGKFRQACDRNGRTKNDKAMMEAFGWDSSTEPEEDKI